MEYLKINNTIEDKISHLISSSFTRLTGFVFKYDANSNVNLSIFKDFLWLDTSNILDAENFITDAQFALSKKKEDFIHLQEDIINDSSPSFANKKEYYNEVLSEILIFLDLLALYIPIEVQKIPSLNFSLDPEELNFKLEEINKKEEIIFWAKVSKQAKYSQIALNFIEEKLKDPIKPISPPEKDFITDLLSKIKNQLQNNEININNSTVENIEQVNIRPVPLAPNSIFNKEIARKDYIQIFQSAFNILWLSHMKVIDDPNAWNISMTYEGIKIPTNKNYGTLTVKRIIQLIAHELERHWVGNYNNTKNIGKIKALSYLWQEEWVAHILEHLAIWYDLDNIPINRYLYRMLVGEMVDWDDFKKFLEIMNKLDGEQMNVEEFFKRFKRGKDYKSPWVNPKEKLYGIWALYCIDQLMSGKMNPLWYFLAKNGAAHQSNINKIVWAKTENDLTPEQVNNNEMVLPILLGELIQYKLSHPIESEKWLLWGFIKYFNDRYGELFKQFWISYKDFIRNYIRSHLTKSTKEEVQSILSIIHK